VPLREAFAPESAIGMVCGRHCFDNGLVMHRTCAEAPASGWLPQQAGRRVTHGALDSPCAYPRPCAAAPRRLSRVHSVAPGASATAASRCAST
jgi:hypothetical protein